MQPSSIRFDNSPKVGYAAFNTMARMLYYKQFDRQVEISEGAICLVFDGDGKEVWALWSANDRERKVSLTVSSKSVTVTDLMSNSRTVRSTEGSVTLTLTAEPIFVRP